MANVSAKNPQYKAALPVWEKNRDAVAGQAVIKSKGERYLPLFVPVDPDRYAQYLLRAYYMNVVGRTKESLSGMVFRRSPKFELPPQMEALLENADGSGQSLIQLSKGAISAILETGRHSFLVDYPDVDTGLTAEQQRGLMPMILPYPAEALINWKTKVTGGRSVLCMAVLMEETDSSADEFEHKVEPQYRVLRLNEAGQYTQQVYDATGDPKTIEFTPLQAGGKPFDHIPLHIAGSEDNKPDVDVAPLSDLADVNIAHYQTTADNRENLFIHGQMTLGITTNLTAAEFKAANPDGIRVGARVGHFLGESGGFHTATAPESSSLSKALDTLEGQMIALGAKLVQRGGGTETAEAARINASAESSTLDMIVDNLSEVLEACLEDCALFIGADPSVIEYRLNKDFWETGTDPAIVASILSLNEKGVIGRADMLGMIRSGKIEFREGRTDEEILADVAGDMLDI